MSSNPINLATFLVFSRVMCDGKQVHTTSDRVVARSADAAKEKIEARTTQQHIVTSVSKVSDFY